MRLTGHQARIWLARELPLLAGEGVAREAARSSVTLRPVEQERHAQHGENKVPNVRPRGQRVVHEPLDRGLAECAPRGGGRRALLGTETFEGSRPQVRRTD